MSKLLFSCIMGLLTSKHTSIQVMPFSLVYGVEVMVLLKLWPLRLVLPSQVNFLILVNVSMTKRSSKKRDNTHKISVYFAKSKLVKPTTNRLSSECSKSCGNRLKYVEVRAEVGRINHRETK